MMADSLASLYKKISADAVATPNWPASSKFMSLLDDKRRPMRYDDGLGPLATVLLFSETYNPEALPLVKRCLEEFDALVTDLEDSVTPSSASNEPPQRQQLYTVPTKAPHICVRVFQEHPSLLPEDERHLVTTPTTDETMERFVSNLSTALPSMWIDHGDHAKKDGAKSAGTDTTAAMALQLDSVLLTPDGAMIAGFVAPDHAFATLQSVCSDTARASLETPLTSRPKHLIHMTLGRILGFAEALSPDQQETVQALVRRYNQERLPAFVAGVAAASPKASTWRVQHLSLLRNTVWLCEENVIYKTWDLTNLHG